MKVSCPISCILLLSVGACFPPDHGQDLGYPGEDLEATSEQPGLGRASRTPRDLGSLLDLARELKGLGKDTAGTRFRFGRQRGSRGNEHEAVNSLPEEEGEKRASGLLSLVEELNGYNRKKGGFSFRFGRRGRGTGAWGYSQPPSSLRN